MQKFAMRSVATSSTGSESTKVPPLAAAIGGFFSMLYLENRVGIENLEQSRCSSSPWNSLSGSWRNSGLAIRNLKLKDGTNIQCTCHRAGSYDICIGPETSFHISRTISSQGEMQIVVNNTKQFSIQTAFRNANETFEIRMWPNNQDDYFWQLDVQNPMIPYTVTDQTATVGQGTIKAPMPCKISRVNANIGYDVQEGDVLVVMEATYHFSTSNWHLG
jgi:acetyl/propionyl-CoA carboxylase alpha subunit